MSPVFVLQKLNLEVCIMKASVAIQVLPVTKSQDELIRIVDEVIDYIKSSGLNYLHPLQSMLPQNKPVTVMQLH